MANNDGRLPSAPGFREPDPQAVPALRASIPSALWPLLDAVFKAGVKRGQDEATAFDWGASPSGEFYDQLDDALHEFNNEGLAYDDPGYLTFEGVSEFRAQAIEARSGETRQRLDPKDESAVGATDAPTQSGQE